MLRVIRDRVPKRTIVVRTGDKPKCDNRCVLTHRAKPRAYTVCFQQPLTYEPSLVVCSVAFRPNFVRIVCFWIGILMLEMIVMKCSRFYKQVAWRLAPKLAVIFRHLVNDGNFPACEKLADDVPVPKKSSSFDVGDLMPIY